MQNTFLKKTNLLLLCIMSVSAITAKHKPVVWKGTNVANVEDKDVVFNGNITLPLGLTYIYADTEDVSVTLKNNPVINNSKTGTSELMLYANAGSTITLHITEELKLRSQDSANTLTFITSGEGNVITKIAKK